MKTKQSERITYKERMTGQDLSKYAKAICFPLVAFAADIWTISSFRAFGTELIAPLSAGIWVSGLITGIILPSHRRTTLNETVIALVGYSVLLMGLRYALQLISGVSTEMLIASYGQLVSLTGGSAVQRHPHLRCGLSGGSASAAGLQPDADAAPAENGPGHCL